MNSFFATVEQQANPLLRGKPIAVSGRPHIHSVVAAASIEAKKFGVRSGMNTWEAKKLCPNLLFLPGDPAKYIATTQKLLKIFKTYTPVVEVFSIDEVFLDLNPVIASGAKQSSKIAASPSAPRNDTAVKIALEIKRRVKTEIGSHITCSMGIAANKFLAKLASEKKKPDGLTVVTRENLDEILLSSKLSDFCGIGQQIEKRLAGMGVYTVAQLRQIPADCLIAAFGVYGEKIFAMARGIDDSRVTADQPGAKSFSHGLTLSKESADKNYVEAVLLYLCEKVARRMRADNFCGRVVFCNGTQKALPYYTQDGQEIFGISKKMLVLPTRAVYVGIADLVSKEVTNKSFFDQEEIITAMDLVNNQFGENTVFRAAVLPVFSRDKNVAGIRIHPAKIAKYPFN